MIGIENRNQLAAREPQGMVDVAGLGMLIVAARDIPGSYAGSKLAKLLSSSIIQYKDSDLVRGIVHRERSYDSWPHHAQRLIVGRNKNIDGGPPTRIPRQGNGWATQGSQGLEVTEEECDKSVELGTDEK